MFFMSGMMFIILVIPADERSFGEYEQTTY